jgi:hypothetical protein
LSNFVQFRTHLQANAAWDFGMNHCWHHAQAGLRNRTPVSGKFDDMALVSFAHDPEAKAIVEAGLDRMVATIENFRLKSL